MVSLVLVLVLSSLHHCPDPLSEELSLHEILSSTSTDQRTAFDNSFTVNNSGCYKPAQRQSVPIQPTINISNINHKSRDGLAFRSIPARGEASPLIKKSLSSQVNADTEKKSVKSCHIHTPKNTLIVTQLLPHKFPRCQQQCDGHLPIVILHPISLTAAQHTEAETPYRQS